MRWTRPIRQLRSGVCIGIFPEGTRSLGRGLRARSGAGRLALAVPEATIVCCRVVGHNRCGAIAATSARQRRILPARRRATARGETAAQVSERLLAEIRAGAPRSVPGRRRTQQKYRAAL